MVDSKNGEDDFTPFRNIINEWYCKDISRKVKSTLKLKSKQGLPIGTTAPYGYKLNKETKFWELDKEAAEIVKRIFIMRLSGESTTKIVRILRKEKVLIPSQYAAEKGYKKPALKIPKDKYLWGHNMIINILKNRSNVGDVVNFKTTQRSFKIKVRYDNLEENREIFENVHKPIISRQVWENIQQTFTKTKFKRSKFSGQNIFSGLLKCSDCKANLIFKFTHDNPNNKYYSCYNSRAHNGFCSKTHHIRVNVLTKSIQDRILNIIQFAKNFEEEFTKIVMNENYKTIQAQQIKVQKELEEAQKRNLELDFFIKKLYEDKLKGILSEERFLKISSEYEYEQTKLKERIKQLKEMVTKEKSHEMNVDSFLELVKKYEDMSEINHLIVHEFIDKIIVHHREIIGDKKIQKIEVYYRLIGKIEIPNLQSSNLQSTEILIEENIFKKQGGFIGNENASKNK
jgi:hypothetical protein